MTCNDCIHNTLCTTIAFNEGFKHGNVEKTCRHFKDKSKIIELPCKVGDTVYTVDTNYQTKKVREYKVEAIEIFKSTSPYLRFGRTVGYFASDIGKIVFSTKEKAEKRLEELKNEP